MEIYQIGMMKLNRFQKETLQAIVGNIKDSLTGKADKKDGEINKCISEDIDNFFK